MTLTRALGIATLLFLLSTGVASAKNVSHAAPFRCNRDPRAGAVNKISACVEPLAPLAITVRAQPAASAPSRPQGQTAPGFLPAAPPPAPDPSVVKARAAGVDTTVLGISLGEALALPRCQQGSVGALLGADADSVGLVTDDQPTPCVGGNPLEFQIGQTYAGIPVDTVIKFSSGKCPAWLSLCVAYGMVRNGQLLAVYMDPENGQGEDATAKLLREKYGKPTKETAQKLQSASGTAKNVDQLEWDLPGLRVEYTPLNVATQRGILRIETETGYRVRVAAEQAQKANQPKL